MSDRAAVAPSATIAFGCTMSISLSSQCRQAAASRWAGVLWMRRLPRSSYLKCLTAFVTYTASRDQPSCSSARSSNLPAGPTNGRPCKSSWSPGCSPTSMSRARSGPSPTTDCVACSPSGHSRQRLVASRSASGLRGSRGSAALTNVRTAAACPRSGVGLCRAPVVSSGVAADHAATRLPATLRIPSRSGAGAKPDSPRRAGARVRGARLRSAGRAARPGPSTASHVADGHPRRTVAAGGPLGRRPAVGIVPLTDPAVLAVERRDVAPAVVPRR